MENDEARRDQALYLGAMDGAASIATLEAENAELRAAVEAAKAEGWAEAVRLYAVWRDGQQLVGVMERPLSEVLKNNPYAPQDVAEARPPRFDGDDS